MYVCKYNIYSGSLTYWIPPLTVTGLHFCMKIPSLDKGA